MQSQFSLRRLLWAAAGLVLVTLGTIGIFVPLLPTTIFYLLAAGAFARSSDRLYYWITHHPVIGRTIRNYRRYRAISRRVKWLSIATLWLTIGASALFAVNMWGLRALLLIIAAAVTWHLLTRKTLTPEMEAEIAKEDAARVFTP